MTYFQRIGLLMVVLFTPLLMVTAQDDEHNGIILAIIFAVLFVGSMLLLSGNKDE